MPTSHHAHRARCSGLTAGLLALAVMLLACGGGAEDRADRAPATGETGPAVAFPVTIEHKFGTTGIAQEPQRVVTVGYGEHDYVLAFGVKPVAVREFFGERPSATWSWAQDELGDAEPTVLPVAELNFEQIAGLRPDLILGVSSGMTESDYETLSKIAPTVAQPEGPDFGTPWQEQTVLTGRALGREQRAEAIVTELEAGFARAREEHPEFAGATAAFATWDGESLGAYSSGDPRGRFLTELGFEIPQEIERRAEESFTEISGERFRLLDQDVLVMLELAKLSQPDLESNPLYSRLDAVAEGRDIYLDYLDELAGALSFSSPLSLPYALEQMVPRLAAAVDGDPATRVPAPR